MKKVVRKGRGEIGRGKHGKKTYKYGKRKESQRERDERGHMGKDMRREGTELRVKSTRCVGGKQGNIKKEMRSLTKGRKRRREMEWKKKKAGEKGKRE